MSSRRPFFDQFGPNAGYIEQLFSLYETDRSLVNAQWGDYFDRLASDQKKSSLTFSDRVPEAIGSTQVNGAGLAHYPPPEEVSADLQTRVSLLIDSYRTRGHLHAQTNPLRQGIVPLPETSDLDLDFYNFEPEELQHSVYVGGFGGQQMMRLEELIDALQKLYCGTVGYQYTHLLSREERVWMQSRIENRFSTDYRLPPELRIRQLKKIIHADWFEAELHRKYVGHKRFSLQGGDTLIPMLDTLVHQGAEHGAKEIIIGMPHRGRLNVLANVLEKPLREIFAEFRDQNMFTSLGSGDVKYHLGFSRTLRTANDKRVGLSVAPNPSHLEFVNPVVEGIVRAKQDLFYDRDRDAVIPVLIHGDAAFAGQGVVAETFNFAGVKGYHTGGTVHVVVNNQIGFTANPDEQRSTPYCSDLYRGVHVPVFHVNAEDIEAACWVMKVALEFRSKYHRDVIIDLLCFRKYGHNEGDDPSFTQPLLYDEIKKKEPVNLLYADQLKEEGVISEEDFYGFVEEYKASFEAELEESTRMQIGEACSTHGRLRVPVPETGVPAERLEAVAQALVTFPEHFSPHPKLRRILEKKIENFRKKKEVDWGLAETFAFGSLVQAERRIRLTGQDSGRGTFSQRHLLLTDYETARRFNPLATLNDSVHRAFEVYNTVLSEAGILGFEFGYSTVAQDSLVLWEAQFGDFVNGAQVHIDQFLSSSEQKWGQLSGLTLLLPHGFEGQGPEHSSARLERFLQLCADGNMLVCYPSQAAQYFHLLRRQGLLKLRRPMVIMTPKSLLRVPAAGCTLDDLTEGQFYTVLADTWGDAENVESVVFLTGKVYHDFAKEMENYEGPGVRVIRIEQLYPFPQYELKKELKDISPERYIWLQEEPQNMGAWSYIEPYLRIKLDADIHYIGRSVSASPATGSSRHHAREQQQLVSTVREVVAG